jgi:non-ribosomal peptide synthetase component E (peptide arylation enzyme)
VRLGPSTAELAALRHPHLFALAGPAVLGSLKADWKVKINSKSIHGVDLLDAAPLILGPP